MSWCLWVRERVYRAPAPSIHLPLAALMGPNPRPLRTHLDRWPQTRESLIQAQGKGRAAGWVERGRRDARQEYPIRTADNKGKQSWSQAAKWTTLAQTEFGINSSSSDQLPWRYRGANGAGSESDKIFPGRQIGRQRLRPKGLNYAISPEKFHKTNTYLQPRWRATKFKTRDRKQNSAMKWQAFLNWPSPGKATTQKKKKKQ